MKTDRSKARARFRFWIVLCLTAVLGQLLWLYGLRGPRILDHYRWLVIGQIGLVLPLMLIAWLLRTTPPNAIRLNPRLSRWIILGVTCLLQGSALVLLWPALSEDVTRYRLDGRMCLAGVSPYAVSPAEFAGNAQLDSIDRLVPHTHIRAIYPPLAQSIFAVTAKLEPWLIGPPPPTTQTTWRGALHELPSQHQALVLRTVFAAFFIAAVSVLMKILQRDHQSLWWAVTLAWNPLASLEIAGMGHLDSAGIFLVLLSLYAFQRSRTVTAAAWLALACGIKPIAGLILPWLILPALRRGQPRIAAATTVAFMALLLLVYLPMIPRAGVLHWLQTTSNFSEHWEANGSFYELIRAIGVAAGGDGYRMGVAKLVARRAALLVLLIIAVVLLVRRVPIEQAGYGLFLVLFLTSPVIYPWYLLWVLCFVPLLHGRLGGAGLLWSGTAAISHLLWRHIDQGGLWRLNPAETAMEYLPVYVILVVELLRIRSAAGDAHSEGEEGATGW